MRATTTRAKKAKGEAMKKSYIDDTLKVEYKKYLANAKLWGTNPS